MKLASFELSGETKIGIMTDKDQNLIDLRAAGCEHFRSQGDSHAAERARAMFPSDMVTFLEGGDVTLEMAKEVVKRTERLLRRKGREPAALRRVVLHPVKRIRLLAPVPRPPKVIGIGGNYPSLLKTWPRPPKNPPMFIMAPTSVCGPNEDVVLLRGSRYIQPEIELCVVIGKRARHVSARDAHDVVAGYTIGNDISEIDSLMSEWVLRRRPELKPLGIPTEAPFNLSLAFQCKNYDTFNPMGPCLITKDAFDPEKAQITLKLNGKVIQRSNTRDMVVKIARQIEFVSSVWTLEPGDVFFTGAQGHLPPLKPGDVMEHTIRGIGTFTNRCVLESVRR
ncbi:MAG: fumarylacetoacetate hydrolase family protein [Nitrospinota bacterium]